MELLRKKHPIYVQKTDNFLGLNPISDIQENINLIFYYIITKKYYI